MKTCRIKFEKAAQKFPDKQEKSQRLRLYKAIYKLSDGKDIKKLKGHNLYRLCVGNYRILYMIDEEIRLINIKNSIFRNPLIFQGLPPIKCSNLMYFPLFLPL